MAVNFSDPYGLDADFETCVLYECCSNQRFWASVGHVLQPECMGLESAALLLTTCREIASDTGRGPEGVLVVLQRLSHLASVGKCSDEERDAASKLLTETQTWERPPSEAVIQELVPLLRKRMQSDALLLGHSDLLRGGDLSGCMDLLARARDLGREDKPESIGMSRTGFDMIAKMRGLSRTKLGIRDFDMLFGGVPSSSLVLYVAGSGGGKSQHLTHTLASNVRDGRFVGFITNELPAEIQLARVYANLTGVDQLGILEDEATADEAMRRMGYFQSTCAGTFSLASMPPLTTYPRHIIEWVDEQEQAFGRKMDMLVIDYMDRVGFQLSGAKAFDKHVMTEHVYTTMRDRLCVERNMWLVSASQATRPSEKQANNERIIEQQHLADSIHKARISDVVVSVNPRLGELDPRTKRPSRTNILYVAKDRLTGKEGLLVGPVAPHYELSRAEICEHEWAEWEFV